MQNDIDKLKLRIEVKLHNLDGFRQITGLALLACATALFSGIFDDPFTLIALIESGGVVILAVLFWRMSAKYSQMIKEIDNFSDNNKE
ncbi:MAG: hypothetical protein PUA61_01810 [Succinatimonas hippei]|nr:hypothetical protein [Succinatimonas hippei]